MIVLSATNESLTAKTQVNSVQTKGAVVSYWSIVAGVWTPKTFKVAPSNIGTSGVTLLPAPASGETIVVENMWLHVDSAGGPLEIHLTVGTVLHKLASFNNLSLGITTITMDRSGQFTRQNHDWPVQGAAASTANVH